MENRNHKTTSRLPASRFPEPAEIYFCDNCGRDLTKNLYPDRAAVWQRLRPMWYVCECQRKYLSGAAEWDDLATWERKQRIRQLCIGFVLFAVLVIPMTLAYFALTYGGAALLAVVAISLIPSILVAKPFGLVLLDLYEIIVSIWRTRVIGRWDSPATTMKQRTRRSRLHKLRINPLAIGIVIAALIIATRWIPSGRESRVSASPSPARSNAGRQQRLIAPAKPSLPLVTKAGRGTAVPRPAFRRVRVGPNEVDDIAEDVTIRHFTPTTARPRLQLADNEVRIGTDVTIRYFESKPPVTPPTPPVPVDR